MLDRGEECDDGNLDPTDECDHECRTSRCGNGRIDGVERCDDGARLWGDEGSDGVGCKPDCRAVETTCETLPQPTHCSIQELVWVRNCSFTRTGCHTGEAREAAGLNLERGAWRELVCAPAMTEDGRGRMRVQPGDVGASYLWTRLSGDGLGGCDFRCNLMPWPNGGLCHEKYGAIREWILAGAPGPSGEPAPGCPLPEDFEPGADCPDAGDDAGPGDAGPSDAGAPDAGAPDAGPPDASPDAA